MTPEQFTAVLTALTALVVALGGIYVQLRQTHKMLNGRTTQLIETASELSLKRGELAGRDFEAAKLLAVIPSAVEQTGTPS